MTRVGTPITMWYKTAMRTVTPFLVALWALGGCSDEEPSAVGNLEGVDYQQAPPFERSRPVEADPKAPGFDQDLRNDSARDLRFGTATISRDGGIRPTRDAGRMVDGGPPGAQLTDATGLGDGSGPDGGGPADAADAEVLADGAADGRASDARPAADGD